ncbi:MAG: hypothetical protein QOJ95_4097, partial [Mycobacterium sp.]|nr:hypothetical protein [Mycobacterium sp.]
IRLSNGGSVLRGDEQRGRGLIFRGAEIAHRVADTSAYQHGDYDHRPVPTQNAQVFRHRQCPVLLNSPSRICAANSCKGNRLRMKVDRHSSSWCTSRSLPGTGRPATGAGLRYFTSNVGRLMVRTALIPPGKVCPELRWSMTRNAPTDCCRSPCTGRHHTESQMKRRQSTHPDAANPSDLRGNRHQRVILSTSSGMRLAIVPRPRRQRVRDC